MKRYHIFALLMALLLLVGGCGASVDPEGNEDPQGPGQEQGDPVAPQTKDAGSLLYKNETATVRLIKNEAGKWRWREDESFPLDQDCVQQLLDQLAGVAALTALTEPGELKEYDLDEPDLHLTLTQADGTVATYYLGSRAETGGNYMYREGEPEKVYIVPDAWQQMVSRSIYDMAILPKLPALTAEQIESVEIAGAEGTQPNKLTVRLVEQEEQWHSSNGLETEKGVALSAALQALAVDRCVDYAPSSGAAEVCGLVQPRATVTITYINNVATETVLTLRLGSACTGGCYALLNEDTTIYRLPQTVAEALLALVPAVTE